MNRVFTIGHSTRSLDDLVNILNSHGVKSLADVRLIPRSRRYPHFNDDALAATLPDRGITYLPFRSLGGRRRPAKDSPNTGWRNESFRGYADFLQTPQFQQALSQLMEHAQQVPLAFMCAEAVPWRCHRSLIADALLVRGWEVLDIMDARTANRHKLPSFAKVEGEWLTYPGEAEAGLFTGAKEKQE